MFADGAFDVWSDVVVKEWRLYSDGQVLLFQLKVLTGHVK